MSVVGSPAGVMCVSADACVCPGGSLYVRRCSGPLSLSQRSLSQATLSLSGNALSLRQRSLSQSTLSLSVNALSLRRTFSDSKSVLVKGLRGALDTLLHKLVPFPLDVIAWTAPRAIAAGALPNASRLEATVRWPHRHLRRCRRRVRTAYKCARVCGDGWM